MNATGHWSLGVLAGLPLTIALVLAFVGLGWLALRKLNDEVDRPFGRVLGFGAWAAALITVVIALSPLGFWPYSAEYHRWEPKTGEVEHIEKRLVATGESGMEEKYVVRFVDNPQEYRIDDTRAALVQPGARLTVTCKRQWQWAATHGYECRWIGVQPQPSKENR